ncbi:unnamed protein product [Phytophthora fragariaefolia]|uniref:Unnamed protein product n=1 Tax=Phytophthora fragariaefolia TaxID=1490495 RepID=A0A9W6XIH2_9STRA|nr:unnamed protein product [Phytophthora fragariaefolia]
MFANGEPDESTLTPVFDRRSFVDDICFGGTTFEDCPATLSRLLARFAECRISISFTKSIFVQPAVDFLSHEVSQHGIRANPAKLAAIVELPFPTSKKGMQGFLGALNYYSRFIQNMAVGDLAAAKLAFAESKTKVANAPILRHFASAREVHIMLFANAWAPSNTLLQPHDGLLHPVRFCVRVVKENEVNYHPAEKEVLALLHILKGGHTLFAEKTLHDYTRFSTLEWVFTSKSLYGRAVSFAVLLSPYHLKVKRIREHDADFTQLLQATVTPHIGLDESLSHLVSPKKNSATVRLDPELLYAHVPRDFVGHVLSFDGSPKTEKNGGYGSCSWILWSLSSWDIVIAASAHLPSTTMNIGEYAGMNNGAMAALEQGLTDLIIVGDSRLAIQQSMGVMASDSLATEALESKMRRVVLSSDRKTEPKELNRVSELLYTSTDSADSGEPRAEMTVMARRQTRRVHFEDEANKDSAGISQNIGLHDKEANLPNSRAEGLQFESPRAPKRVRRVEDQAEVEVSEGRIPDATDIDPAVVQAERRRRISKAQDEELRWADLKALLRGEPDSLTHRRAQNASKIADSFVLSEDGLLATLSYRPQANGQQERSVKTMIQTVRGYVEDPLQADCDDIAEKMVHAINNSRDTSRRETPFYLVQGWDAQSTLKSMTSTIKKDPANSADAAQWRREANRQREIALQLAKEYQLAEKAQRAEAHNARLSGKQKRSLPESTQLTRERSTDNEDADSEDEPAEPAEPQRSLFRAGDQVWLFMERVRPGLKKKLAHRWHGPFRVKKKVEEFAYELELPDKSGYRFYPVVHVSRLKKVADLGQRPTAKLVDELSENDRFDFDEELLPEDSWELSDTSDKYEVEAILDDKIPNSTSTSRAQRLFKVK